MQPLVTDITTWLSWEKDAVGGQHLSVVLFYSRRSEPSVRMIETFENIVPCFPAARFFTVDVDKNPEITWRFRVSIVPTIMMFQRGQKLHEMITLKTADEVEKAIQGFLVQTA